MRMLIHPHFFRKSQSSIDKFLENLICLFQFTPLILFNIIHIDVYGFIENGIDYDHPLLWVDLSPPHLLGLGI